MYDIEIAWDLIQDRHNDQMMKEYMSRMQLRVQHVLNEYLLLMLILRKKKNI